MSQAFEVTPDDVKNVFDSHYQTITDEEAAKIFEEHILPEDDRITKAALYGNDMAEQTKYAYDTIAEILYENEVLQRGTSSADGRCPCGEDHWGLTFYKHFTK